MSLRLQRVASRIFGLAVSGICVLPVLTRAQTVCDTLLTAADGAHGYRMRENRCEGRYRSVIHGEGLTLVSFTVGGFTYNLADDTEIQVAPPAGTGAVSPLWIRAVARPLRTYYRMDARLAAGEVLRWPVRAVLAPGALTSSRIGVFGYFDSAGQRVYFPVRTRTAGVWSSGPVRITVRTADDLDRIRWRVYPVSSPASPEWTAVDGPMGAGTSKTLNLPPGPSARLRFEFTARPRDSDDWQTLRLDVLRPAL